MSSQERKLHLSSHFLDVRDPNALTVHQLKMQNKTRLITHSTISTISLYQGSVISTLAVTQQLSGDLYYSTNDVKYVVVRNTGPISIFVLSLYLKSNNIIFFMMRTVSMEWVRCYFAQGHNGGLSQIVQTDQLFGYQPRFLSFFIFDLHNWGLKIKL